MKRLTLTPRLYVGVTMKTIGQCRLSVSIDPRAFRTSWSTDYRFFPCPACDHFATCKTLRLQVSGRINTESSAGTNSNIWINILYQIVVGMTVSMLDVLLLVLDFVDWSQSSAFCLYQIGLWRNLIQLFETHHRAGQLVTVDVRIKDASRVSCALCYAMML